MGLCARLAGRLPKVGFPCLGSETALPGHVGDDALGARRQGAPAVGVPERRMDNPGDRRWGQFRLADSNVITTPFTVDANHR